MEKNIACWFKNLNIYLETSGLFEYAFRISKMCLRKMLCIS